MFVDASSNNESQKHYSRQKKTDTNLYILYDSIYLKLKEIIQSIEDNLNW